MLRFFAPWLALSSTPGKQHRYVGSSSSTAVPLVVAGATAGCFCYKVYQYLSADRWLLLRTHKNSWIRELYHFAHIYRLAWRIDWVHYHLAPPIDAILIFEEDKVDGYHACSDDRKNEESTQQKHKEILDDILSKGPSTFQAKPTNVVQIQSLVHYIATNLIPRIQHATGAIPSTILDIGAGKALLTRVLFEVLNRTVAVVALDSRPGSEVDQFYDPPHIDSENDNLSSDQKTYRRVVADVRHLTSPKTTQQFFLEDAPLQSVLAITKHLCGGATDASLISLCDSSKPLAKFIGACCLSPCCHQKTKRHQYCNIEYLQSLGFCQTHKGKASGRTEDGDFRTFGMLINMSKAPDLREWEYKKSRLLQLLGPKRTRALGIKVRRILEEGRMRYLREQGGFDNVCLIQYCEESVTSDNLAIIAIKLN